MDPTTPAPEPADDSVGPHAGEQPESADEAPADQPLAAGDALPPGEGWVSV